MKLPILNDYVFTIFLCPRAIACMSVLNVFVSIFCR
jgi:hypothetical protein